MQSVATNQIVLTTDDLKSALPDKVKKSVNQQLIDGINSSLAEPELYEIYRENLLSYGAVMAEGRFKVSQYISAIKYCSHKFMGQTNIASYSKTFPEKIQRFAAEQVASKDVASYVTAYNKSKLVTLIMEQAMIPVWLLNQDLHQKALNVQAELMQSANSEKVRSDAANSILTHLKQPENQSIELKVTTERSSAVTALEQATLALVAQQRQSIQAGQFDAQEVAHAPIEIDGEATVVSP
jgi:hypothetical protein